MAALGVVRPVPVKIPKLKIKAQKFVLKPYRSIFIRPALGLLVHLRLLDKL